MSDVLRPIDRLLGIMAALRNPETGCPWDIAQSFATIAPFTLEEAYEVLDAIERDDMADLQDELGDLLLQVVFHARMAEEAGHFAFDDVVTAISDKLERRHPHIFGTVQADTADAVHRNWEAIKAAERADKAEGDSSVLAGVAKALPALQRAVKLQKRAARVGFDWDTLAPVLAKVREELDELDVEIAAGAPVDRVQAELGDLLFATANLARHLKCDPEQAARDTCQKFERRFRAVEAQAAASGRPMEAHSLAELDVYWNVAKRSESP
ncbi:MAG: nucleoside triphosphate pyrophosphohydrolase [Pseudomonadota bacterium]